MNLTAYQNIDKRHVLRKNSGGGGGEGRGYSQKNWVGMCGPFPETRKETKIYDFPYPISDLTKNLDTLFQPFFSCYTVGVII